MTVLVALGRNNAYYCQNSVGGSIQNELPNGLNDSLTGRKKSLPKVAKLNLDPDEVWFVRFAYGSWSCGGHSQSCNERLYIKLKKTEKKFTRLSLAITTPG